MENAGHFCAIVNFGKKYGNATILGNVVEPCFPAFNVTTSAFRREQEKYSIVFMLINKLFDELYLAFGGTIDWNGTQPHNDGADYRYTAPAFFN